MKNTGALLGQDGVETGATSPLSSDFLRRFVRDELQGPVAELASKASSLLSGQTIDIDGHRQDLERTRTAADNLAQITAELAAGPIRPVADWNAAIRRLRHDLRTPLTAILGYSELVSEEAADAGQQLLVAELSAIIAIAQDLLQTLDKLAPLARERLPAAPVADAKIDVHIDADTGIIRPAFDRDRSPRAQIRGRILVVDDNAAIRDLTSRKLERDGHDVLACNSGEAALELSAQGEFDLVMLDLLMPGIDGLEVLRRMKARTGTLTIPVIVMSALNEVEAAVRCIEAGADDYLSKPLDDTLLRARIGSSLERKFLRDRERETLELLKVEQDRSEMLLRNILPVSIVKRLHAGESVIADHFDEATVLFCDLVGFTATAAQLQTRETLELLEGIFSRFDGLAEANGLEKIKTIGDAYMVVGGIPDPLTDSAPRILTMAREMERQVQATRHGTQLGLRIGIHTGPAAGGIIGTKKFFYDVWGDTVNTASRLEASCKPGRIHVSAATVAAAGPGFTFEALTPLDLAGKGLMQTFYLVR